MSLGILDGCNYLFNGLGWFKLLRLGAQTNAGQDTLSRRTSFLCGLNGESAVFCFAICVIIPKLFIPLLINQLVNKSAHVFHHTSASELANSNHQATADSPKNFDRNSDSLLRITGTLQLPRYRVPADRNPVYVPTRWRRLVRSMLNKNGSRNPDVTCTRFRV